MPARSIASLSLTFGLVSIPVRLYSATESSSAVRFKLMASGGGRVRQTYVTDTPAVAPVRESPADVEPERPRLRPPTVAARVVEFPTTRAESGSPTLLAPAFEAPVARSDMVKGYEYQKGQFVLFTSEELKALEEAGRQTIDIVSFIPEHSVDALYYDKSYFLAPDRRSAKPYSLLLQAMRETGRCALAKWAWRSKEYVVQVRPTEGGLVLQQLLYADEVRSIADLNIDLMPVSDAELALAKQFIEQISAESYDPTEFVDEEKQRILEAVERKIAGKEIVVPDQQVAGAGGEVVDLMSALRASLATTKPGIEKPTSDRQEPCDKRKPPRRTSGGGNAEPRKRMAKP